MSLRFSTAIAGAWSAVVRRIVRTDAISVRTASSAACAAIRNFENMKTPSTEKTSTSARSQTLLDLERRMSKPVSLRLHELLRAAHPGLPPFTATKELVDFLRDPNREASQ